MRDEDFARVLRNGDDEILPSSGFVASVMEAVQAEAMMPPPIPFPWMRAFPGLVGAVIAFVSLIVVVVRFGRAGFHQSLSPTWWPQMIRAFEIAQRSGIVWIVLALTLAFVSVRISMRLAGGKN